MWTPRDKASKIIFGVYWRSPQAPPTTATLGPPWKRVLLDSHSDIHHFVSGDSSKDMVANGCQRQDTGWRPINQRSGRKHWRYHLIVLKVSKTTAFLGNLPDPEIYDMKLLSLGQNNSWNTYQYFKNNKRIFHSKTLPLQFPVKPTSICKNSKMVGLNLRTPSSEGCRKV